MGGGERERLIWLVNNQGGGGGERERGGTQFSKREPPGPPEGRKEGRKEDSEGRQ
jgi:hypothetical protein